MAETLVDLEKKEEEGEERSNLLFYKDPLFPGKRPPVQQSPSSKEN
jgi:hypothetical protein